MAATKYLTLKDALETGRINEFAEQEQKRGIGPIDAKEFETAIENVIAPPPKDRTSRSASRGGSREK